MVKASRVLAVALAGTGCALASCVAVLDLPGIEIIDDGDADSHRADASRADAPGSDDGGTSDAWCVDVSSDPANCGRCGHVCPGACAAGACSPVVLAPVSAPTSVQSLALTSSDVVFVTQKPEGAGKSGAIHRCAKAGCSGAPSTVTTVGDVLQFDVSETHLGWIETPPLASTGEVRACALADCPATTVSFPGTSPGERAIAFTLAVASASVYWSYFGAIRTCTIQGCGQPTVFESVSTLLHRLVLTPDDLRLAFTDTEILADGGSSHRIRSRTVAAGPATPMTPPLASVPRDVAFNETDALYIDIEGELRAQRIDGSGAPRAQRVAAGTHVALDDAFAYFSPAAGLLVRCRVDACVDEVVAKDLGEIASIAVDARFVYVATPAGVVALAKP